MTNQTPDVSNHTIEDFISDMSFISWVLVPTPELSIHWKKIQATHPEQIPNMNKARQLIVGINFKPELLDNQELDTLWKNVDTKTGVYRVPLRTIPLWFRTIAAISIVAIFGVFLFFNYNNRQAAYVTAFGEKKTVVLPDSSIVLLNANSKLNYSKIWSKDEKREVWVSGEAFFTVKHLHRYGSIEDGDRFVVHTDKLDINVLGTTFNVNDRRGLVNVALVSGKVSLEPKSKRIIIMKPGEIVEYQAAQDTIIRIKAKIVQKVAWKNNRLEFHQTPVKDVFMQIEDMYGYKVLVRRQEIFNKKITGTFLTGSESALLKGLSIALGVTFTKSKSKQLIVQ